MYIYMYMCNISAVKVLNTCCRCYTCLVAHPLEVMDTTVAPGRLVLRAKVNEPVLIFQACMEWSTMSVHVHWNGV